MEAGALANLRRGTAEHCVLALLRAEPRWAGEIAGELVPAGLLASEGTLYPLLSRLRRDGLVSSALSESPAGPPRRYYDLTAAGRLAVKEFTDQWRAFRAAVDTVLGDA